MGVQTKNSPALKRMKGVALVGACFLMHWWDDEMWSRKSSLSNTASVLAHQTPKHCTAVYNTHTGFYHSGKLSQEQSFIFCRNDWQVNSNTALMLHRNLLRMFACTYLIGQHRTLPDDIVLQQKMGQVQLFCRSSVHFLWQILASAPWPRGICCFCCKGQAFTLAPNPLF